MYFAITWLRGGGGGSIGRTKKDQEERSEVPQNLVGNIWRSPNQFWQIENDPGDML